MKFFVAQLGAREHYSVPRVLHRAGRLGGLYTDFWAGAAVRGLGRNVPGRGLRALVGRWHRELETAPVHANNFRALRWEIRLRRELRRGRRYEGYVGVGQSFGSRVAREIRRQAGRGDVVFAYDTGALEILKVGRERGARCIVNQMDPGRTEEALVGEERERWRGWEPRNQPIPEIYHERREQEWAMSDRVVVNSEFSRRALMAQGVPEGKLLVVPLAYEVGCGRPSINERGPITQNCGRGREPLRVLFLGQVILRKGIQYLMEAARLLGDEAVVFDVVGPVALAEVAVKSAPSNLTFHGRASRDEAARWYSRSDVFVLPTISDGFALTQLEAMAHGLPVIATPNCGEVVRPGVDGMIVPIRDGAALAQAIMRFANEPAWRRECAKKALERVKDFSLERLATNLLALAPKP